MVRSSYEPLATPQYYIQQYLIDRPVNAKIRRMTISELWTILGVMIGLFAMLAIIMISLFLHLDSKFEAKFDAQDSKFEAKFDAQDSKFEGKFDAVIREIHQLAERQAEMNGTLLIVAGMAHKHPEMPATATL